MPISKFLTNYSKLLNLLFDLLKLEVQVCACVFNPLHRAVKNSQWLLNVMHLKIVTRFLTCCFFVGSPTSRYCSAASLWFLSLLSKACWQLCSSPCRDVISLPRVTACRKTYSRLGRSRILLFLKASSMNLFCCPPWPLRIPSRSFSIVSSSFIIIV